jgi:hypothetical protein
VASDPTVSRLIARLAGDAEGVLAAISAARERVWGLAGAPTQDGKVVIDLDATLIAAHSEKQDATRTWKKGFGFHPLLGFVAHRTGGGGEPVGELLRPGRAGSNTAADHVVVFDAALAQLSGTCPARMRQAGWRCWSVPTVAGPRRPSRTISPPPAQSSPWGPTSGISTSIGLWRCCRLRRGLRRVGVSACQARQPGAAEHGVQIEPRDGAWVAEITALVDLYSWSAGTRLILRKERPHPGAQLRTTDVDGMQITGFLTNTATGQLADLELRHRRHARVEDRIRAGKDTGLRNLPYHDTTQNRIWLALAADLLAPAARLALPAPPRVTNPTAATADPGRGRPDRDHRPTPHPQNRPHLALGRRDHHRARPAPGTLAHPPVHH